jgi:hypothetical protein
VVDPYSLYQQKGTLLGVDQYLRIVYISNRNPYE